MRPSGSVRFRLTIWYCAVLFAGLCLTGLLLWFSLSHSLRANLDESLQRRTKGLERYLAIEASDDLTGFAHEMDEYSRSLPADYVLFVEDSRGNVLARSSATDDRLPKSLAEWSVEGAFGDTHVRGVPYRSYGEIYRYKDRPFRVVLAGSAESINVTLNRLSWLLLTAIPGVLLFAAAGGFWIAKRALAPVDRMIAAANGIDFNNLSARLDVPRASDELQRLAVTWNAMLQRLENSARRMNRFTADASHELRTPLSLIQAATDLALRRPRDSGHYVEALEMVRLQTGRMGRLVDDLLFLARTDADFNPHRSPVDLRLPIEAAWAEMIPKAAHKDVRLLLQELDSAVTASVDEDAIRRLVLVLLDNAVKYSPAGGAVTIALRVEETAAVLTVHDTGCGIPPEAQPHIFERFYRADSTRHSDGGYGLGLAIAKAVSAQHGVDIEAESQPGSTTFSVRFSASDPAPASAVFQERRLLLKE